MNPSIKHIQHWIGGVLALAGILFVVVRLHNYSSQLDFSRFNGFMWYAVAGLALVYGLANIVLALAWKDLLVHFGITVHRLWAVKIYGLTQLAKYVPGNIMHLASRQAMGSAAGVRGWLLAKASVWELGLISMAGAFFSVLVLPQFLPIVPTSIATLGFVVVLLLMVVGLKRYVGLMIARAFGWYLLFLAVSGMVFVGLLMLLMEGTIVVSQVLLFCGAFVVAWVAGVMTPGAPAGVGVREFVLMVVLEMHVYEADLLLAVLLSRLVTVTGDVLFFLFSSYLSYRTLSLR